LTHSDAYKYSAMRILFAPSKNCMISCRKSFCVHNFSLKFIDENSFKIAKIWKDGENFMARDGRVIFLFVEMKFFSVIICINKWVNLHTSWMRFLNWGRWNFIFFRGRDVVCGENGHYLVEYSWELSKKCETNSKSSKNTKFPM